MSKSYKLLYTCSSILKSGLSYSALRKHALGPMYFSGTEDFSVDAFQTGIDGFLV